MTLFAFRGVKSHGWTFYDPINIEQQRDQLQIPGYNYTINSVACYRVKGKFTVILKYSVTSIDITLVRCYFIYMNRY